MALSVYNLQNAATSAWGSLRLLKDDLSGAILMACDDTEAIVNFLTRFATLKPSRIEILFIWASIARTLRSRRSGFWLTGEQEHRSNLIKSTAVYPMELEIFVDFKHLFARRNCNHLLGFLSRRPCRVLSLGTFKQLLLYLLRCAWSIISCWKWSLFSKHRVVAWFVYKNLGDHTGYIFLLCHSFDLDLDLSWGFL